MKTKVKSEAIKCLPEYIDAIVGKKEQSKPATSLWFRGHGSIKYELVPNLFRKSLIFNDRKNSLLVNSNTIYQIEQNIDVSFSKKATIFLNKNGIKNTEWNRYFLKQHYQVHTRLLDWTENALTALFFALTDPNAEDQDGEVIVLSPFNLNNYSIKKLSKSSKNNFYHILSCSELPSKSSLFNDKGLIRYNELLRKYYRLDLDEGEELYPIAIYPQHLDERMSAQQACFTMFGNVVKGFQIQDSTDFIFDKICIPAKHKKSILQELKLIGFNYYNVFPDLDGLGRAINDESTTWFENSRNHDLTMNILTSLKG